MKSLSFVLWLLIVGTVSAAPFLVSDPYVPASDPNLNPTQFIIHGLSASDITINATTLSGGNLVLEYDLATLPNGQYTVTAAALNIFGGESPFSVPFAFTKGVPGVPTNLHISPVMLTWIPFGSRIPRISSPSPLRRPLALSFS